MPDRQPLIAVVDHIAIAKSGNQGRPDRNSGVHKPNHLAEFELRGGKVCRKELVAPLFPTSWPGLAAKEGGERRQSSISGSCIELMAGAKDLPRRSSAA